MLVTDLVNVRYLSGFTGSNAALLVRADDETPVLATDGRYVTQAAQQVPDAEVVIERACAPHLAARAATDGAKRLGFVAFTVAQIRPDLRFVAANNSSRAQVAIEPRLINR